MKDFESAANYRDVEYQFEREVMLDYMRMADVAHFRILDRDKKEVICYMYCEMLKAFFKIE